MIREFDILTHPLRLGTQSLIEASAGTGKTSALENLVLRLLIEGVVLPDGSSRRLELSEILLVTFTEAATAELIQRVREKISNTLKGYEKTDKNALILRRALLSFDESSIFTIHGFCKKMLINFTFESNSRFNLELINDDQPFLEEVVNDYWRGRFYNINDELEKKIIKAYELDPRVLHKILKDIQRAPLTKISAPVNRYNLSETYREFEEYCLSSDLLHTLNRKSENFKSDFKKKILKALNCFIAFDDVFCLIKLLKRNLIEKNLKVKTDWAGLKDCVPGKNKLPADFDCLLELAEKVEHSIEDYIVGVKFDFIRYAQSGVLKRKKLAEGVLSFDDLLMDMYEAVRESKDFCKLIAKDYPVVMLDEFQDTDPLQFRIFDKIFNNDNALMLMVGDPKQSIYQFRGADIFSYLQVSKDLSAKDKSTLTKNYRSDEYLLKAFNCIFDNKKNPFIEKSIEYLPVIAGREQRELIIEDDSANECKLKIMKSVKMSKEAAGKMFKQAISDKIVSMLSLARGKNENGQPLARFEDKDGNCEPVMARDIAVLVARKEDALLMYEQLASVGVHATVQRSGNIFESNEATELLLLFNAIIQPGNSSRIKSVLATSLFGLNASALDRLGNESGIAEMGEWQEMFFVLLRAWLEKGFIQMFFQFLRPAKTNVKANLLTLPQGERRLTNLLHLMELLHQQVVLKQLSPTALIHWLHQQINNAEYNEEHELRLESDESAVKIMTVHKSKGLQFPIVFCLNLWQNEFTSRNKEEDFFYHDEEFNQCFVLKSSDDEFETKRQLYHKENLGELIRLTYVALTRAKNYCCFTLKEADKNDKSALAYLSTPPGVDVLNNFLKNGGKTAISQAWLDNESIEIIDVSQANLTESSLTGDIETPEWGELPEIKAVSRDWGIMSFSAITAGSHQEHEVRPGDDDESNETDSIPVENTDLFSNSPTLGDFPRGPVAGNCIHSIFEKFNFADVKSANWQKKKAIEQMIKEELFFSGMIEGAKGSTEFVESESRRYTQICDMLENVLTCSLPGRDGAMSLCDLHTEDYRPEMQFFFPADKVLDATKINELLEHLSGRKSSLSSVPLRGFVNGFIDLVFESSGRYYIIDWKSNDLGGSLNDYDKSGMAQSMYESYYYLQSAIYLFALHKYLKNRLPDYDVQQHLGGAFYVYIRGVKNDFADTGVYNIQPEQKTLQLLRNIFETEI